MHDDLDRLIQGDPFAKTSLHPALQLKEGERREVCILFADCHGFTALSERLDHEVVHNLLDKLMQLFSARIKHFGGFIDKYEGDMVMALFGAKVASEQDTERTIEAGLQMLAVLKQFNRAVSQRLGQEVDIAVRIGINTGEVTTGRVGEKREGDFTVYGDAVNLASRMESNAPLNRIMLPASTMRRVAPVFDFEPHGSLQVKGKSEPVDTWLVTGGKGERLQRWQLRWTAFVGRESEMARLQAKYEEVRARLDDTNTNTNTNADNARILSASTLTSTSASTKPVVVGLKGEAGMGKSRLVDEFLRQVGAVSFYLQGTTPRLVQQAYGLFVSLIRRQLRISLLDDPAAAREKLERGMEELREFLENQESRLRLRESLPLIGNLLSLSFDDVRLTLPPKDLQPHLQTAIRYFIETCAAKANRSGEPLVVVLEDLQWTDAPSLATLEFLLFTLNLEDKRHGGEFKQILFLLTYRPEFSLSRGILADSEYEAVDLSVLTPDLARALVASIVGQTFLSVPDETLALVMERSAGNPFFIEEWASYIAEHPVFASPPQAGEAISPKGPLPVPATLQALILARMDQLEAELKLLLQKAAVLGREFFVNVVEAMERRLEGAAESAVGQTFLSVPEAPVGQTFLSVPEAPAGQTFLSVTPDRQECLSHLDEKFSDLEKDQFVLSLPGRQFSAYMFKHILTQEVAYGTLLIANRKVLHRIAGEVLEELFADHLEEHWRDLAEHYEKGEVWNKAAEYLLKAADQAKERYDNRTALICYDRLLQLQDSRPETLSPQAGVEARLGKGEVLILTGEWRAAEEEYKRAVDLANEIDDRLLAAVAFNARGKILRLKGEHDPALNDFQKSLTIGEEMGDKTLVSEVIGNIGNVFWARGDYDRALESYQKHLSVAEESRDKKGISSAVGNIGNVFCARGDYDRALECYQKDLSIAEELGDKRVISIAVGNIGNVFYNRGDYDRSLQCYHKKLSIAEELGDKQGISIAVGNMGNVFLTRGDYDRALECYHKKLFIAEELGDKQGISLVVGNIGRVFLARGDYDRGLECFQKRLSIAEELGDKRGISYAVGNMGNVFWARGDYDRGLECFQKTLSIAEELGDKRGISYAVGNIGTVHFEIGDYQRAEELLERAVGICRELNLKPVLANFLQTQARLALAQNQLQRAINLCREALELAQELKNTEFILQAQTLSHKIDFIAAEDDSTRAAAADALAALLEQTESDEAKAEIHYELAAVHRALSSPDEADHHRQEAIRLYESLYTKIPKQTFKKRAEELRQDEVIK